MADLKQAEEQLDNRLLCWQEDKTFILRASVAQYAVYVWSAGWDEKYIGQNDQGALHDGSVCHSRGPG